MNIIKHKALFANPSLPEYKTMTPKTKVFIQKICYKKTASVDMTRHGFINDRKMHPINLLLKPLREQLESICGKRSLCNTGKKTQIRRCECKDLVKPKRSILKKGDKISKRRSTDMSERTPKVLI